MPEYQKRTIVGALPTGDNAIGKLAANDGVDIGNVDIASIAAGDNNIGNVDIVTLPSLPTGTNIIGEVKTIDDSGNHMASMDTVARAGFAKITDGTETVDVDEDNQLRTNPSAYGKTTIIRQVARNSAGTSTLYTVTAGKTFYLVAAALNLKGAGDRAAYMSAGARGTTTSFLTLLVSETATYMVESHDSTNLSPSVPMPFPAGTAFEIWQSEATAEVSGCIMGWEE